MKKAKIPLIRETYPKVRILLKTNPKTGTVTKSFQVDCENERWKGQKTFSYPTRDEALTKAREVEKLVMEQGFAGINHEDLRLVERLRTKLTPYNVDLETAVESFIKSHEESLAIKSTEVVVNVAAWYYEDKKNGVNPLKGKGLIGINTTRNALVKCFGDRPIGEITKEDITTALTKHWNNQASRADYLGRFRTFFKWAMGKKYVTDNPCGIKDRGDAIKIRFEKPEQQILDRDNILNLLGSALSEPESIPFFTLALFQGMRPEEIKRMEKLHKWNHIYLDERKLIYVPKDVSKTFNHNAPLHDNVIEWLNLHKGQPLYVKNHRRIFERVKKGIHWQKDIMRHTSISYFMGKYHDLGKVANWMGNSPTIITKHYQVPVLEADVEWFWSLTPTKVKELIKEREAQLNK